MNESGSADLADVRHPVSEPKTRVFESAIDWWVWPILLVGPVLCLVLAVVLLVQGQNNESVVLLISGLGILFVTGLFTVPCRYTILADSLTIRCGILFYRVPFEKIESVELSGSWISGPALSLKRVKVSTPSKFYLISPLDREVFIKDLETAIQSRPGRGD